MKPFTGVSNVSTEWWKEGPLRLIADYPNETYILKISKEKDAEFVTASELQYTEKSGIAAETTRVEYTAYCGQEPFWPTKIVIRLSLDTNDGFEIKYDNPPRSISGKTPSRK
jgi:hypothetical protein